MHKECAHGSDWAGEQSGSVRAGISRQGSHCPGRLRAAAAAMVDHTERAVGAALSETASCTSLQYRHLLVFLCLPKQCFCLFISPREKLIMEYFFLWKRRLKPLSLSIYKKTIKYVGYYITKFWWKLKKFNLSLIVRVTQTLELEPYCEMYRHIKWVWGEEGVNCPSLLEVIIWQN